MDNEDLPPLIDDSHANSDDEEEYDEEVMGAEPTMCLFCDQIRKSIEEAITHLKAHHSIDFIALKSKFSMDQYSFIKLINYIRLENIGSDKLAQATEPFWNDEKYLKPKEYEPWLSYDFEELPSESRFKKPDEISDLRQQVQHLTNLLQQADEDMSRMRLGMKRVLEKDVNAPTKSQVNCVSSSSLKVDEGYFSSYAHFGIHHEMLSDVVRTTSYRDALLKNKDFIAGKDVLDVGCGTSVLSIFASKAGAKTVVGIDNSDIIYNAMDIIKQNNVENVTLVKGRLEDTVLPQEKYDIIVSEWMGYFLLFEGMLDSIIYARDKHLADGGIILPNRCTMHLLGYGNDALFEGHVKFWDNVYDLDMSTMRKEIMHEPLIEIVDPKFILTEANTIADLNMATVDLKYSNFSYNFKLKCTKNGNLSSFVGYFDTYFDLPEKVMFGTSPNDTPTHWKQVVFLLQHPREISEGEIVSGTLTCKRSSSSARSLDVTIEAFGAKQTYYLD